MIETLQHDNPFRILPAAPSARLAGRVTRWLEAPVARLVGLKRCADLYAITRSARAESGGRFAESALATLGVGWEVGGRGLAAIPTSGPTLLVANHPYGGLEGLALMAMLRRVRPDVKVLANHLLWRIPELREQLIPVNPFGTRQAQRTNLQPLRQALQWLAQGGLIVIFPAGEVAHYQPALREVSDPEWHPTVGRLARRSGATVVPVHFPGHNGLGFQLAGLVHPRLRTLLLPRQLLNKAGKSLRAVIGAPIPPQRLKPLRDSREVTDYLRLRTYLIDNAADPLRVAVGPEPAAVAPAPEPLMTAVDPERLAREVATLPAECLLYEQGVNQVWCVTASQAPALLTEIGRLRELTFRAHGEGTGRHLDLDGYDDYYQHLFLWQSRKCEVVGAYRLGPTDTILAERGVRGLYTETLFKYRDGLFDQLGPALELGRSFVRPEYQRSFSALLLLWQGIGRYLVRHPRYRTLFGPVSISREYSDFSRRLMTSGLQEQCSLPELTRFVAPRMPVPVCRQPLRGCDAELFRRFTADIPAIDALIADIEAAAAGIPVLLRHYLKLGGKILAFNLDPAFSEVIDGLILVDLDQTEGKTLERYLGRDGLVEFQKPASRAA